MAKDDYAVIVGISKYPVLETEEGKTADLLAPDTDAQAIRDWLIDPTGGDVPHDNIRLIYSGLCTSTFDPENVEPQLSTIHKAMTWLRTKAEENPSGLQVGRRLYIYMSGHGFSPGSLQGGLYMANASPTFAFNTFATGWLQWFQDHSYFEEFVLWLDCCMDRQITVTPESIAGVLGGTSKAIGPTFIGFAAPRNKKTVERPIAADDGTWHGVFTWTLLEGLKRGVPDPDADGRTTGRSLKNYLHNAMKSFLTSADKDNQDIAKEPQIPMADPLLIFGQKHPPQQYPVTLRFGPTAEGKEARIWSGKPPSVGPSLIVSRGSVSTNLELGLHMVEVIDVGLRQGIEATGSNSNSEISVTGPAVRPGTSNRTFILTVTPADVATEIFLIDSELVLINRAARFLSVGLPFGIYKVKVRRGGGTTEEIILLDRDVNLTPAGPALETAAPIEGTALTHEYQIEGALKMKKQPLQLTTSPRGGPHDAEIRLMVRVWTGSEGLATGNAPWRGVALLKSNGDTLIDLTDNPPQYANDDPFVTCRVGVSPGIYFLRQRLEDGREVQQSLVAPKGWAVETFLLSLDRANKADTRQSSDYSPVRRTILMDRLGSNSDLSNTRLRDSESTLLESARIALVDERHILSDELEDLLLRKFENPIAGIIGAHLAIMEADRAKSESTRGLKVLDEVVPNLRSLVGDSHPDVEAISLRCPTRSLRSSRAFNVPPMFYRSWELMVDASADNPELVPESLWTRIHALINASGYLVWAADPQSKSAHLTQLKTWFADAQSISSVSPSPADSTTGGALDLPDEIASVTAAASDSGGIAGDDKSLETYLKKAAADQLSMPLAAFKALMSDSFTKNIRNK